MKDLGNVGKGEEFPELFKADLPTQMMLEANVASLFFYLFFCWTIYLFIGFFLLQPAAVPRLSLEFTPKSLIQLFDLLKLALQSAHSPADALACQAVFHLIQILRV